MQLVSCCRQHGGADMRAAVRSAAAATWPGAARRRVAAARLLAGYKCAASRQQRCLPWSHPIRCFSGQPRVPELYRLLDIKPSATSREIKRGFLQQARLHHPDVSSHPDATRVFDRIQAALATLSDPVTRRAYDVSFGCEQPDYVYSGTAAQRIDRVPLAAMTEAELQKEIDHLGERLRSVGKSIIALGDGANVYRARGEELSEELRVLTERRAAVREELQKIAAVRIRHVGGARARRKRPVFHAEYEYAERYSDVYKCAVILPARAARCAAAVSSPPPSSITSRASAVSPFSLSLR